MIHGEKFHRADPGIKMLGIASWLVKHGYNVLMFDIRGHGESEGSKISGGYYEKRDLLGAVEYVKGRGFERIGVLGFSMLILFMALTFLQSNPSRLYPRLHQDQFYLFTVPWTK